MLNPARLDVDEDGAPREQLAARRAVITLREMSAVTGRRYTWLSTLHRYSKGFPPVIGNVKTGKRGSYTKLFDRGDFESWWTSYQLRSKRLGMKYNKRKDK